MFHEHQRPDRDEHIEVDVDRLPVGYQAQFMKYNSTFMNITKSLSMEYDTKSIMHYDGSLAGWFPNTPILVDKTTGKGVTLNTEMSPIDIKKLNEMYPCQSNCQTNG